MGTAIIQGYLVSLSLILAIGAQNAFVLRQGIRREYVGLVVAICALSDAVLIGLGVTGFALLAQSLQAIEAPLRWAGATFLFVYGALRFRAALRGGAHLDPAAGAATSWQNVAATCLLLTWANPHVYLDTVVLMGSISAQHRPFHVAFGVAGAMGSLSFFTALGFGARALAPLFARPSAWVWLEFLVGVTMWAVALGLLLG